MKEIDNLLAPARGAPDLTSARERLAMWVFRQRFAPEWAEQRSPTDLVRSRDCARVLLGALQPRSDELAGFSLAGALWDLACGRARNDLQPGFCAELIHLVRGLEGRAEVPLPSDMNLSAELSGREAALLRSNELDRLWAWMESHMARYPNGLSAGVRARRLWRRSAVLRALEGRESDWSDWHWHLEHVLIDAEALGRVVPLRQNERAAVECARAAKVPFGVTPFYASLIDEDPEVGRDRALRAQVLPSAGMLAEMVAHRGERDRAFDFMLERDTSPVDLITRRYPGIVILKPYNACPQICVYCQRNWEIDRVLACDARAAPEIVEAAMRWIEDHPAISEVLVTGGDPLTLEDDELERILARLARIPSVDHIRIGSRIPVTLPMRVTEKLADMLGALRSRGRRAVTIVTHVEHPYELSEEMVLAVDRLRRRGLGVYNQMVYTFFVSRRFEAALLRRLLVRVGIDPYYTFVPKGKQETADYRVPIARLLQEQKEEARLLPGTRRTDEVVYNVPRLGKNYIRAFQHRDVISILPDGSRVYRFHPWEKYLAEVAPYVSVDPPILDYLERLARVGENPDDYASIWYYA